MRAGINRFVDRETARSVDERAKRWKRDPSSTEAYEKSIAPNRQRLRKMIGAVDDRLAVKELEFVGGTSVPANFKAELVRQEYIGPRQALHLARFKPPHELAATLESTGVAPDGSAVGYNPRRTLRLWVELTRQMRRRRTQLVLGFLVVLPFVLWAAVEFGTD